MSASVEVDVRSAVVEYRPVDGEVLAQAADRLSLAGLYAAAPFRTFRWHEGQRNYSGKYWSATESDHVIYESRLELAALLLADFDPSVHNIKAQPFRLIAVVNGRRRRHIPDYLLRTDAEPVVVDVVRGERLQQPKIQQLCSWTKRVVESLSWRYEVVCEQPPVLLENVRFLAGYRRDRFIDPSALEHLRSRIDGLAGMSIGDALSNVSGGFSRPLIQSAMMHLLWRQELIADLTEHFGPSTVLEVRE